MEEMDFKVGHKYRLGKRIGRGAFGDIYYGTDITCSTSMCAKMTSRNECGHKNGICHIQKSATSV